MNENNVVRLEQLLFESREQCARQHRWDVIGRVIAISGLTGMFMFFAALFVFIYIGAPGL
jgi:hypothetical protein